MFLKKGIIIYDDVVQTQQPMGTITVVLLKCEHYLSETTGSFEPDITMQNLSIDHHKEKSSFQSNMAASVQTIVRCIEILINMNPCLLNRMIYR